MTEQQQWDPICSELIAQCKRGWPRQEELPQQLRPYWIHQSELHLNGDLLMKGQHIVIPETLQSEMLTRLHEKHIRITECRLKAPPNYKPLHRLWGTVHMAEQREGERKMVQRVCPKRGINPPGWLKDCYLELSLTGVSMLMLY